MNKLNKLLNDLSKHPTSFNNIEKKLKGVHLDEQLVFHTENDMGMINYKFKGFSKNENSWTINVDMTNPEGEVLIYKLKNQKLLKERVYELLIKISNTNRVMMKINKS